MRRLIGASAIEAGYAASASVEYSVPRYPEGLDFGAITSGANGTVTIAQASGTRSVSGGVGAIAVNVGKAGAFAVNGQSNAAINVVVGAYTGSYTVAVNYP